MTDYSPHSWNSISSKVRDLSGHRIQADYGTQRASFTIRINNSLRGWKRSERVLFLGYFADYSKNQYIESSTGFT
jgi:hypothetical protein